MMSIVTRLKRAGAAFANPQEEKSSRTAPLLARLYFPDTSLSPRDLVTLTRMGYENNPVVYRCVRMIAESAASITWRAYDGDIEQVDHPALMLVQRPNSYEAGPVFLEALISNLLLFGNAYVEAVSVDESPRELWSLRPDRMSLVPGPRGWPQAYDYTAGANTIRFELPREGQSPVLHLKSFAPLDDHYGFAPVRAAQSALDMHNAASDWNRALLNNAARPSGALVYAGPEGMGLSPDQFERLRTELDHVFSGAGNAGRPFLLEGGLDWKSLSLTPQEMDFINARAAAAREIALAFGVPPLLLGLPGDNTHANYQEANRAFWRQTIIPLIARVQKQMALWLQPSFGSFRFDYDIDRLDALADERVKEWARLGTADFLTRNEKREAVGYGPAHE